MTENITPEVVDLDGELDFELIIGDAGGRIDNGDVPIRWCMKPDFVHQLKERNIVDPHVLIASYAPRKYGSVDNMRHCIEMDRRLVPLSELMTYLRFTRAGDMKVYGIVLDGTCGRGELHKKYMRKHGGEYDNIVDSYADELYDLDFSVCTTSEHVQIPAGVFGKEPSPLVKWYVNLWHGSNSKVTDECDFRKRMIIAIPKTAIFVPYIIGIIAWRVWMSILAILCGHFKDVRLLRAFRPYKYPSLWWNVFDDGLDARDNFFLFKRKSFNSRTYDDGSSRNDNTTMLFGLAFTPIVPITIAILASIFLKYDGIADLMYGVGEITAALFCLFLMIDVGVAVAELLIKYKIGDKIALGLINFISGLVERIPVVSYNTKKLTLFIFLGIVATVVFAFIFKYLIMVLGLFVVMTVLTFAFFGVALVFATYIGDWLDKYFALSAKDNNYDAITALLCAKEEDNLRPNYKYIPKKQRTVRLWYHDLKNKVCKPMQQ